MSGQRNEQPACVYRGVGVVLEEMERREKPMKWWYTAPGALTREEAIAAFRTRFGREADEVRKLGEGSPYSLWCMGPINDEESKRLGKGVQDED